MVDAEIADSQARDVQRTAGEPSMNVRPDDPCASLWISWRFVQAEEASQGRGAPQAPYRRWNVGFGDDRVHALLANWRTAWK